MTRDETIKRLREILAEAVEYENSVCYVTEEDREPLEMSIKALEVLDKIRAEIEEYELTIDNAISEDELKIEGMKEAYANCLEIIDEYKAESE